LDVVEEVLLGHDWQAEAGIGLAPVCPNGRGMFSNLSLDAGSERFDRLEESAVVVSPGAGILFFRNKSIVLACTA
jgi:hypothetical protein